MRSGLSRAAGGSRAALGTIGWLGLFAGCSTAPRADEMVVNDLRLATSRQRVLVRVERKPTATIAPAIDFDAAALSDAIERSIAACSTLTIVRDGAAELSLQVDVHDASMSGGLEIDVFVIAVWRLVGRDGSTAWQYTAEGRGFADFGEAFWGYTRVRLATERACKAMISNALSMLDRSGATAADRR
ncbi:MAG TPA: hypothetical protein VF384_17150 [Planctomycetota bacterium]